MRDTDSLCRFLFEGLGIRGAWVHLDASWQAALAQHDYPPPVLGQFGQAMAAAALLSSTIKFEGSLILQAQGSGPLTLLVAQANHRRQLRGLAHWQSDVHDGPLAQMYGQGRIAITIIPDKGERYQGIVALQGDSLADALRNYFGQSEQLETRLWLAADQRRAAGLLLQKLPSELDQQEDWSRISLLGETLTDTELLALPAAELLFRLFNEEQVRLFEADPVAFRCDCSRERFAASLRALGREELTQILQCEGSVKINCEFCNRHYHFDRVDVEGLFNPTAQPASPATPQ